MVTKICQKKSLSSSCNGLLFNASSNHCWAVTRNPVLAYICGSQILCDNIRSRAIEVLG